MIENHSQIQQQPSHTFVFPNNTGNNNTQLGMSSSAMTATTSSQPLNSSLAGLGTLPSASTSNNNNNSSNYNSNPNLSPNNLTTPPIQQQTSQQHLFATSSGMPSNLQALSSTLSPHQLGISPRTPQMIDHVKGRTLFLSRTQGGSRFVQEKLSDRTYFEVFYEELQTHVAELMIDNFGHYAIEALFQHCNENQKYALVSNLSSRMSQVACHKQGSFSIQAMMDTLQDKSQIQLLSEALNKDIKKIILNHSGHYGVFIINFLLLLVFICFCVYFLYLVILRFLQRYEYPDSKFIHKALMQYTVELATDHYGLRVMKAAVDAGPIHEMINVFAGIVKHANSLVENQYGNYIIQHLLDVAPPETTDMIKEKLHGKFVRYSKQKFSSNVVEKCLRHSSKEIEEGIATKNWRDVIVHELLSKTGDLISDKYGNYCLQTALQEATKDRKLLSDFREFAKPYLETLRENVKVKWMKLLESADDRWKQSEISNEDACNIDNNLLIGHLKIKDSPAHSVEDNTTF